LAKKIIIIILVILAIPVLILFEDGFFNMEFDPLPLTPQCASIGQAGTFENPNPDFVQRFFDKDRICQTLNVNDPSHDECIDEWLNGTPGFEGSSIPPQDEFGRLKDEEQYFSVIFQCSTPDGRVTHNFISL